MRAIDKDRFIAMADVKVRARSILIMAEEYEKTYKDTNLHGSDVMDSLDEIWRIITTNQLALAETVRKNCL